MKLNMPSNIKLDNMYNNFYTDINESFTSLTGEKIDKANLTHNNMQKYIKGNVTQNTNLDNYIIDSNKDVNKLYNNKKENEPFFIPQTNMTAINGSIFQSSYLKDRTSGSLSDISNNVFPLKQVRVAPGLDQGFDNKGIGGFHNFETNIYSRPKDINNLRIQTNQKEKTYGMDYQAPSNNISNRGIVESFNKNKPEKVYQTNENNWFKTTGANLKESKRPVENLKETFKESQHVDYKGSVKLSNPGVAEYDEYGKNTILVYDNERQTTQNNNYIGGPTTIVKSLEPHVIDPLKLTNKQYTINSTRENGGNIKGQIEKPTVYDPINYINKTTVKETTIHDNDNLNLKGAHETYSALYDNTKTTVKETTIHDNENLNLKGANETYSALYDNAKITVKETTIHDNDNLNLKGNYHESYVNYDDLPKTTVKETTPIIDTVRNVGNVNFKTYVYDPDIIAKTTVKETTIIPKTELGFLGGLLNGLVGGYTTKKIELPNTNKEFTSQNSTRGNVSSINEFRQSNRQHYYEAPIDNTRENLLIAAGHTPNPGNQNIPLDSENIFMKTDKIQLDNKQQFGNIGKIYQTSSSINQLGDINKEPLRSNAFSDRLDNNIMSALKTNELNIFINPI